MKERTGYIDRKFYKRQSRKHDKALARIDTNSKCIF